MDEEVTLMRLESSEMSAKTVSSNAANTENCELTTRLDADFVRVGHGETRVLRSRGHS